MSEGTSPSSSYDEGSRSTPSNLPKAATRTRRKRISDSEDEDYVAAEEEVSSKKNVFKKEFVTVASTKPGMHKKAPAKRVPMSKARASTQETIESKNLVLVFHRKHFRATDLLNSVTLKQLLESKLVISVRPRHSLVTPRLLGFH